MAKKSGLGGGLDSIFDDDMDLYGDSAADGITMLRISEIEPNKGQPRKSFDPESLNALADSIREHGVIQPLTVRQLDDGTYQIVAGERRWRASKIAGIDKVPVRIMNLSDEQTMQIALIENLQREDLNPIEEALGYQQLIDKFSMKQEDVAKKVGKARSSVTNSLRLLALPEKIRSMVSANLISQGHCKALLSMDNEEKMVSLAEKIVAEGLSVRATEKLSKDKPKTEKPQPVRNHFFAEAEISLCEKTGKNVRITEGKHTNVLSIEFSSEDELKELLNKF